MSITLTSLLHYGFPYQKALCMRLKPNFSCNICFCKIKINIREDSLIIFEHKQQFLLPQNLPSSLTSWVGREETIYFSSFPFQACKRGSLFKNFHIAYNKAYSRIKTPFASLIQERNSTSYLAWVCPFETGLSRKIGSVYELIHLPPSLLSPLQAKRLLLFGWPSFLLQCCSLWPHYVLE